tara:strand:- start:86 stop:958 length:873 start_codon:yes stop_codon:yes gene_type:complete
MISSDISISPSGGGVGAFVDGVDLSQGLSDNIVGAIRSALGEHGVLFFRDQTLTPDQHIAFAKTFGPININRFFPAVDGHPEIAEVRKEPEDESNIGNRWHSDHSYDIAPALGSVLLAHETPTEGGDTIFASMFRAYDALSVGLKKTVDTLRAVHSSRHVFGRDNAEYYKNRPGLAERFGNADAAKQDSIHPLVIRHPISDRKALYVNPAFTVGIEGWNDAESAPFLDMLYQHAVRPENTYRYQWAPGSIAFWDNRATWHYAVNDYHGSRRLMHRITIEGVPLESAAALS